MFVLDAALRQVVVDVVEQQAVAISLADSVCFDHQFTEAKDYLPYLFGSRSWVLVRDAAELPRKLPILYARLTN